MSISPNKNNREFDSYIEDTVDLGTNRRVQLMPSGFNPLENWALQAVGNNILASYPSATTEVYKYRQVTTVVYELTVTYTNSTKEVFLSVERTA